MRLKGRKLHSRGVYATVNVEEFRNGDGESNVAGYFVEQDRAITVDRYHQDDNTLAHEAGHFIAQQAGVYLAESAMLIWEDMFAVCRDPRNEWFVNYLLGEGRRVERA